MPHIETHAAALATYDPATLTGPDIPAAVYLHEGDQTVALLADPKIGPTIAKHLEMPDVAGQLTTRIATFREAQQGWWLKSSRRKPEDQATDEVDLAERVAEGLAQLEWWGRRDRLLQDNIEKLREGTGIADLLTDGDDTAKLLDDHSARFPADGDYNPGAAASDLRDLTARVRAGQIGFHLDTTQAKLVETRDRAFAWCDELLTEIRAAARFAFRKDKATASRFTSAYVRRRNQKYTKKSANPPAET